MELYGYEIHREKDLSHHGILGQRWGKQNGPPYPLDASDHSASEKKAGWRKSLDKSDKKGLKLTPGQKKAIVIGASVVAAGLIGYGLYKSGALNNLGDYVKNGKSTVDFATEGPPKEINGIPALQKEETIQESLNNTNPHLGEADRQGNCTTAAIAGFCRQQGLNVRAGLGSENGYMAAGAVEEVFPGIRDMRVDGKSRLLDGSAVRFGRSKEDAEAMLIKRFGANAEGICAVQWHKRSDGSQSGHTFSWKIVDGKVTFIDYQQKKMGSDIDFYWRAIDPNGSLVLARLDGLIPDKDGLSKYCEIG